MSASPFAETVLDPEPDAAVATLVSARADGPGEGEERLTAAVAAYPLFLEGWAQLSAWALADRRPVEAYAYARVGYHRGLDRVRAAGWRGSGPVPYRYPENRGFLRSVLGLMEAAAVIGEQPEAQRCRDFLLQLDPDDGLGVADRSFGVLPMA